MEEIRAFLANPAAQLVAWTATIVSLLLAALFYVLAKRDRKPSYATESKTIVEGLSATLDGLSVIYAGQPQERITVTKVYFWNAGREAIRRTDLLEHDPLRILVGAGAQVLSSLVIHSTDPASRFECDGPAPREGQDGATAIKLKFDYLDHDEGGTVQIVHNGSASHPISMVGKVIGSKSIPKYFEIHVTANANPFYRPPASHGEISFSLLGYVVVFIAGLGGIGYNIIEGHTQWYMWIAAIVAFGLACASVVALFQVRAIPRRVLRMSAR